MDSTVGKFDDKAAFEVLVGMFTDKSIENESIYDDLVVLQNICKGETDLKNTFYTLVQE